MNIITINVDCPDGYGRNHILATIELALMSKFGPCAQIVSYDLALARAKETSNFHPPDIRETIFVLAAGIRPGVET